MRIIIYSILIAMTLISGIYALTGASQVTVTPTKDNNKTDESVLKDLFGAGTKLAEHKSNLYSKVIALAVYFVSIASLISLYITIG